jgi:dihydrolipoamide dehydrogenase
MTKSQSTSESELVVIGGGPGGYAAAFLAADLGVQVTMIDAAERPGGACLHVGCIPSKALLHVARVIAETREVESCGIKFGKPKIDLDALRQWKDKLVATLAGGITELCKRREVTLIRARAIFENSQTVRLDPPNPAEVRFQHAILATGSSPTVLPGLDLKSPRVMDSTGALRLEEIPETLLVIGGGYIGLELGTAYAALGSEVTVVEMTDGLLPGADRDLVKPLHKRLEKTLHAIHLKTKVAKMVETKKGIEVAFDGDVPARVATFGRVLVAVGRRPNTGGLGLEHTKVGVDGKGFIRVDDRRRTTDEHIYAIGDIAGEPMLAHKATREAKVAVESIAGEPAAFDCRAIPAVVFTDPEIAWCGLSETDAQRQGREIKVASFPWAASGRAATLGRTEGLTKLVLDPATDRVLGVGIVGVGAGELIAEGVLAVEMGANARDLALTIHPHPTLTETICEAAEVHFGHATHLFRPKR